MATSSFGITVGPLPGADPLKFKKSADGIVRAETSRRKGRGRPREEKQQLRAQRRLLRQYRRYQFSPEADVPPELVALNGAFAQLHQLRAVITLVQTDHFGRCASFAHCRNYIDEHRLSSFIVNEKLSNLAKLHCRQCAEEWAARRRQGERGPVAELVQGFRDLVVRDPERVKDVFAWSWVERRPPALRRTNGLLSRSASDGGAGQAALLWDERQVTAAHGGVARGNREEHISPRQPTL